MRIRHIYGNKGNSIAAMAILNTYMYRIYIRLHIGTGIEVHHR